MKNTDLLKEVIPTESELKNMIVNYVGRAKNPESDNNHRRTSCGCVFKRVSRILISNG